MALLQCAALYLRECSRRIQSGGNLGGSQSRPSRGAVENQPGERAQQGIAWWCVRVLGVKLHQTCLLLARLDGLTKAYTSRSNSPVNSLCTELGQLGVLGATTAGERIKSG